MGPDPALVQVEAGNRALKSVFGSKLTAKGRSLAELLQPHSTGKIVQAAPGNQLTVGSTHLTDD